MKLYKLTTDLYLDFSLKNIVRKINLKIKKMLHARLINLGLNYMEVLYLMEFLNRNNIVYTHDFYKICKFKIRDTDRDEYSMKKKTLVNIMIFITTEI